LLTDFLLLFNHISDKFEVLECCKKRRIPKECIELGSIFLFRTNH